MITKCVKLTLPEIQKKIQKFRVKVLNRIFEEVPVFTYILTKNSSMHAAIDAMTHHESVNNRKHGLMYMIKIFNKKRSIE